MTILKKFSSIKLFFTLSFCLLAAMTAGTLIPQNQPPEKYYEMFSPATFELLSKLGIFNLYHSVWFTALLALLGVNTFSCITMRIVERKVSRLPWGALMSHVGFLVILIGGMISAMFGVRGEMTLTVNQTAGSFSAFSDANKSLSLPFQVRLTDFNVDYYGSGQHFVKVKELNEGWEETLEVEPGKKYEIKNKVHLAVLQYLPDFRMNKGEKGDAGLKFYSASSYPNNPALEVTVSASPERHLWLFAKYPEFSHMLNDTKNSENHVNVEYQFVPSKVKQFNSKIEILKPVGDAANQILSRAELSVNHPFKFGGYTFFQSGYDPDNPNFSSFQVSKDPGVPFVYAGFLILPLGLSISFYGKKNKNGSIL